MGGAEKYQLQTTRARKKPLILPLKSCLLDLSVSVCNLDFRIQHSVTTFSLITLPVHCFSSLLALVSVFLSLCGELCIFQILKPILTVLSNNDSSVVKAYCFLRNQNTMH